MLYRRRRRRWRHDRQDRLGLDWGRLNRCRNRLDLRRSRLNGHRHRLGGCYRDWSRYRRQFMLPFCGGVLLRIIFRV